MLARIEVREVLTGGMKTSVGKNSSQGGLDKTDQDVHHPTTNKKRSSSSIDTKTSLYSHFFKLLYTTNRSE